MDIVSNFLIKQNNTEATITTIECCIVFKTIYHKQHKYASLESIYIVVLTHWKN